MDLPEAGGATTRIWLHASGLVPAEPVINGCVVTYLTVLTLLEPALGPMGKSSTDVSALLDHTVWFRRPADFSDWLFFEQNSPSGIGRRSREGHSCGRRAHADVSIARSRMSEWVFCLRRR